MAAISRIGTLLQIGFGEAGAEIIASNLSQGGAIDPMVPGRKRTRIFGFTDIRGFTDATECLKQDIMLFVNQVRLLN